MTGWAIRVIILSSSMETATMTNNNIMTLIAMRLSSEPLTPRQYRIIAETIADASASSAHHARHVTTTMPGVITPHTHLSRDVIADETNPLTDLAACLTGQWSNSRLRAVVGGVARAVGDAPVRELLADVWSEYHVGEIPRNPAGALVARLRRIPGAVTIQEATR